MTGLSTPNKILFPALRYAIACILLLTGLGKLLDVPGFVEILKTYQALPGWSLVWVAVSLVLVELKTAEWLFRGRTVVLGAFASLVLHSAFTLWAAVTLLRGVEVPNCGCFGVFWARPLTPWTLVEDLVMVSASLYVLRQAVKTQKPPLKMALSHESFFR